MNIYRHGDLLLVEVETIPEKLKEKKDGVLLEGEATGHYHRISGAIVKPIPKEPTSENDYLLGYLKVDKQAEITHEEHKTIVLPAGNYKYLAQREYDPQEEHIVID